MKRLVAAVAVGMFVVILCAAVTAETGATAPVAPRLLSQTGLYADIASLKVDPRNRLFSPQYPLWSDGASKRRWIRLPAGSQINVADPEKWVLPVGTKFWKEFSFNGRKVETRFLWQTARDRWTFASYAWNEAQTDAVLAADEGVANVAEVADGKRHSIPSVTECRSCHDSSRTEVLGFDALQLSTDRDGGALHGEPLTAEMVTLRTLVDENLIAPRRTEFISAPPRIAARSPQTRAALGYLSTNCGSCHNRDSSIAKLGLILKDPFTSRTECSAAIVTTLDQRGHWVVPEAPAESRMINPGHPDASAIIRRTKSRRPISQMPPIGTVVPDRAAIDLLTSWVNDEAEWEQLRVRCAAR